MATPTPDPEHDDNARQRPMIPRVIVPFRSDMTDEELDQSARDIFGPLAGEPSSPIKALPFPPADVVEKLRGSEGDAGELLDPWGGPVAGDPDHLDPDDPDAYDPSQDPTFGDL